MAGATRRSEHVGVLHLGPIGAVRVGRASAYVPTLRLVHHLEPRRLRFAALATLPVAAMLVLYAGLGPGLKIGLPLYILPVHF